MAEFWTLYLWPLIVIVAQSLLLLVLLLVSIAYVLLADRKSGPRSRSVAVPMWLAHGACCSRLPIF